MAIEIERKWFAIYAVAATLIIVADRVTKLAVTASMPLHSARPVIDGFFDLVHTRNTGMAFSLLADASPAIRQILIPALSVAAVALVVVLFFQGEPGARRFQFGLALVLAGAVGNLYDRAVYGFVVDFLDFYVGGYHWPAFNVADSAITTGAGLLVLDSFHATRRESSAEGAT